MSDLPWLWHRAPPWDLPESTTWSALAADLEVDPKVLERLLHGINAPASAQCFEAAIEALRIWLPEIHLAGGLNRGETQLWRTCTEQLLHALQSRRYNPRWRRRHEILFRDRVWNLCASHPYYAALVSVAGPQPESTWLAQILSRVWPRILARYFALETRQHIAVGRALRGLYDEGGARPCLQLSETCSGIEIAQALDSAQVNAKSGACDELGLLSRVLRDTFLDSDRRGGGGGGGGGGGPLRGRRRLQDRVTLDEVGIDPDCPVEEEAATRDYRAAAWTRRPVEQEFETEPMGMAPGDLGDTELYVTVPADRADEIRQRLDKVTKRVEARAISNDIAMRAQPLSHRWELFTPAELATFFVELERLAANEPGSDGVDGSAVKESSVDRYLAVLLCTMLLRGMKAEAVVRMRLERAPPGEEIPLRTGHVLWVSQPGRKDQVWQWESPARLVAGGIVRNTDLVRATTDRVRLRIEPPFAAFFARVLPGACRLEPGQSIPLIRYERRVLDRMAAWCAAVNRRHGTRMTIHRISHYLYWQSAVERALDPVMVAYVRGTADLASATQAYYQHCDPAVLQSALSAFWRAVVADALAELPDEAPSWLSAPWPERGLDCDSAGAPGLGSQKVPTPATMRRVVAHLRGNLRSLSAASMPPWEYIRRYHNAYTLYTVHYVLLATGARAVRDPLPDLRFIDTACGLVLLCDKSADDLYSTRVRAWSGSVLISWSTFTTIVPTSARSHGVRCCGRRTCTRPINAPWSTGRLPPAHPALPTEG